MTDPRPGWADVSVPLTCGELVQGMLEARPFLVSCPIDRYARVRVTVTGEDSLDGPADRPKALAAVRSTLRHLGRPALGARLRVCSELPRGRGFGTSTADVVGAIVATARALGRELPPDEVAHLAVGVEPSDSTMFPGLATFDYRAGTWREPLGPAPRLALVILDFGGGIDTVTYNTRLDLGAVRGEAPRHSRALALLRDGLMRGDLTAIGRAATLSALANQGLNPKPRLESVLALCGHIGGLGVCCAHSGTAMGILMRPDHRQTHQALVGARALPGVVSAWSARLVDGGARASLPAKRLFQEAT